MTDAERLKLAGQSASLFAVSDQTRVDFERILRTVPLEFSINDCRDLMDAADIPLVARGGLFNAAVKAGLIDPKYTMDGYPCRIPSTGTSAHKATVVVYTRSNFGRPIS